MYLSGDTSAEEIATELKTLFKVPVAVSTVYSWIKLDKWKEDKLATRTAAIEQVKETETQRYARLQGEHLNTYERLRKKAGSELDTQIFDRAFDAAKALDIGIKGERTVMEGMINLQFVQNVLSVIVEEISDEEILRKVAFRLKALIQTEEPSVA